MDEFVYRWRSSGKGVAVCVHPSTHPDDSDAVFESSDGVVHAVSKGDRDSTIPNMSSAGVFALTRDAVMRYHTEVDIGSDLLVSAAQASDLYPHVSSHYFRDTGTPERLKAARTDFDSGAFARRGSLLPRPAIFLDRDGIINPAFPEVYQPSDFALIPGVADSIRAANQSGVPVFVVTNQPGIAKGFMTFETHEQVRATMDQLLSRSGGYIDDYAFCPHYPEAGCMAGGRGIEGEMLLSQARAGPDHPISVNAQHRSGPDIMIRDHKRDKHAAQAAGVAFILSVKASN